MVLDPLYRFQESVYIYIYTQLCIHTVFYLISLCMYIYIYVYTYNTMHIHVTLHMCVNLFVDLLISGLAGHHPGAPAGRTGEHPTFQRPVRASLRP